MAISVIKKRDGRIVPFDVQKISEAIQRSFAADEPHRDHEELADSLAWEVYSLLDLEGDPAPTVERVQDIVEQVLMREGYSQTAKSYILFRQERTNARNRDQQGCGTVIVEPSEEPAVLTEQALRIYGAVRDNGGCQCLRGFYETLAPGVAGVFDVLYGDYLRMALELKAELRLPQSTLRAANAALAAQGLRCELGENEAWLAGQAKQLCQSLCCEREPVETAQRLAAERARQTTEQRTRRIVLSLLAHLEDSGCPREAIAPCYEQSAELRLLRELMG